MVIVNNAVHDKNTPLLIGLASTPEYSCVPQLWKRFKNSITYAVLLMTYVALMMRQLLIYCQASSTIPLPAKAKALGAGPHMEGGASPLNILYSVQNASCNQVVLMISSVLLWVLSLSINLSISCILTLYQKALSCPEIVHFKRCPLKLACRLLSTSFNLAFK